MDENVKRIWPEAVLIGTKAEQPEPEPPKPAEYSPAKERIRQAIREGNLRSLKKQENK